MNKKYQLIILSILFIVFFDFFKIPYNSYLLIKRPYEERMISNYGYCEKEGYGYIKFIINKYNLSGQDLSIINKNPTPSIYGLVNLKQSKNLNKIILINFQEHSEKNVLKQKIKTAWYSNKYIDLSNFKLIHRYGSCFYLQKL
tara:strand:- start:218 stop:646 length:429 start_codon:yes stop_codon:yes gene_type:complete